MFSSWPSSLNTPPPKYLLLEMGYITSDLAAPLHLGDGWLIPHKATPEAAWVIDPEGRHRFWVPVE